MKEGGKTMDDIKFRIEKYINNVENALSDLELKKKSITERGFDISHLLVNVKAYLDDAKYFLKIDKLDDALISISYSEGLIDSLKFLNLIDIKWPENPLKEAKVFVAGTFDILHPGHIHLLKFASQFGKVYVVIARDINAYKNKGRPTILDENTRLEMVSSIKYVYRAMLGDEKDIIKPIETIKPDVIVLGPDQPIPEEKLASLVEARINYKPVIVRFKEKDKFSGDLKGSTDILIKGCEYLEKYGNNLKF
ncbi:DUF357 domain-containing protein [Caldisphaera sp.]|uniref:DUF357 domain-containing protein n=1 Tax=Caldisphaera sp. TaxID=2060322 RepID=UPI0025C010C2|nr:DUF357 domain-containing protein [Caldisphaera sp.]